MKAHVLTFAWGLCGVLWLGGCKDDAVSASKWPATYAKDLCQEIVTCKCDYENPTVLDHCVNELTTRQLSASLKANENTLSFDGSCADRFLDDLHHLECRAEETVMAAKCQAPCKIWYGPMGKGATCVQLGGEDNCRQGLACSAEGICVDPCDQTPPPKAGEPCLLGVCAEGSWCDQSDELAPICRELPAVGKPCQDIDLGSDEDLACAPGAYCNDGDEPLCVALPKLDQDCEVAGECEDGVVCDGKVCVALPQLGERCIDGQCVAGAQCDFNADDPVCVVPPPRVCGYYSGTPGNVGEDDGETTTADTSAQ